MEHIHRNINHLGTFEVVIQQNTLPTADMILVVEVTNKANRTYFHGRSWKEMIERYGMELGTKLYFYLDGLYRETFFHYKQRDDASSSDHEFHDPRDSHRSLFITHPWSRSRRSDLVTWLLCSMYIITWSLAC
jgi:hypothetical protein